MSDNKRRPSIVSLLAGAWRNSPADLELDSQLLQDAAPLVLGSLAGALAWWKVKHSDLASTTAGLELQEAYRFHTIRSALREHSLKQAISFLAAAGVEPILVKGWAIARLYPEPGLRPYGDFDLVVRPKDYEAASSAAKEIRGEYGVDLHSGFDELDYHSFDELYARSTLVKLDDLDVRVLSPEDHLRVLCLHMLHHSAFRPLWLCDIAVAVETRAPDFNWDICLGKNPRRADWIACSIGLAHRLLGANIDDTPIANRAKTLPAWLISNVLKQWETPYSMSQPPVSYAAPMSKYLRDPRGLLADLRRRWPNAIEATVYTGGPFNELPRWPFQIGECVIRAAKFLARISS
jgi:putative nucleotidyltransferase-like protein